MIAALFPAFCGALGYAVAAEFFHRRKLRRQVEASRRLLEQARITIQEQAVDKMALMGQLEALQADKAALQAELIGFYDRAVA